MSTNLSNWREGSHNVWAFQNLDQIISTHVISRGSKPAVESKRSQRSLEAFQITDADGGELNLAQFLMATETDGFVVLKAGEIVHEQYARANNVKSRHVMMSMTKPVTGCEFANTTSISSPPRATVANIADLVEDSHLRDSCPK